MQNMGKDLAGDFNFWSICVMLVCVSVV